MGLPWSKGRHRHDNYLQNPSPISPPTSAVSASAATAATATISSSSFSSSTHFSPQSPPALPPPLPPPQQQAPSPNQYPLPIPPPQRAPQPPPPPPAYSSLPRPNYSHPYLMPSPSYSAPSSYYQPSPSHSVVRHPYHPQYYPPQQGGWWYPPPPRAAPYAAAYGQQQLPPPQPPPPYVEHQRAKTVKNDVNVHKDTIRLVPDELNPDQLLVTFTFDATVDGSVTIYYFAKEGANGIISALYEDIYEPKTVSFQKGPGQKFVQLSGSGIDLGFFELDELSKVQQGDAYPLVVYAKAAEPSSPKAETNAITSVSSHAQITLAIIEKNNDNFQVRVMKQVLWIDGERYELQEIFGLVSSVENEVNDGENDDEGKECVICLTEPKDTAVLPCRHMCMCSECAKALRLQSNKCPICRQPVEKLMEIKVNSGR